MPKEFTLRNKIAEAKAEFHEKGGRDEYWSETLAWTLQDYHGSMGSVLDFTEDDWLTCKENCLALDDVCTLCDDVEFISTVDDISKFFDAVHSKDCSNMVGWSFSELSKTDCIEMVEDFYKWREELLPKAQKIYSDD